VLNRLVAPSISGEQLLLPTNTDYGVIIGDSRRMHEVPDSSVHLVVTSPPYPMVGIWDDFFQEESAQSYDEMHNYLNQTWKEVKRVLVPGGIACVNIGDATRTRNGTFHLYPNHSRVIESFERLGLVTLPYILWKKPTTKPRYKGKGAFLGSGFLPTNAYVTLDMEYILIFRKGNLRSFAPKDPKRYRSKFTKEQRDEWFSQVWTVTGARQTHGGLERRTAAFPEEIPRRLIRMFSIEEDMVLDPFLGSGTTLKAAMDLGRRFIGYEKLGDFSGIIKERLGPESKRIVFQDQLTVEQVSPALSA
jgi:modification methylase